MRTAMQQNVHSHGSAKAGNLRPELISESLPYTRAPFYVNKNVFIIQLGFLQGGDEPFFLIQVRNSSNFSESVRNVKRRMLKPTASNLTTFSLRSQADTQRRT